MFAIQFLFMKGGGVKQIAVIDATTSEFGARVTEGLAQSPVFAPTRVAPGTGTLDSLTKEVGRRGLEGFLILTDATVDSGKAEYRASNVSSFTAVETLERVIAEVASGMRLEREGVDPKLVARAKIRVDLATMKIAGGKTTAESSAQSFTLAYFMAFTLFMAILIYGVNVMSSVLEEKTTRIIEVLLSSIRSFDLMLGKLVGVGAVSILQFGIWAVSTRVLLAQRQQLFGKEGLGNAAQVFQMPHVTGATVGVFIAYFIGGFLLYSAMFAAVGAMSSNEQEARQAQQPVTYLLVIAYVGLFAMLNDPSSNLSVILSMVPFTAPIAMPVRWVAGNLPLHEVALSLFLLFAAVIGVTWVASRIYRVGMLMTGKRPNLKELVRWVRAA